MRKPKRQITYSMKKRLNARRIVRLCKAIARKDVSEELAKLIEDHIVAKLPNASMRRLVAMKLTVPFFA
jgi:hypothetical protein